MMRFFREVAPVGVSSRNSWSLSPNYFNNNNANGFNWNSNSDNNNVNNTNAVRPVFSLFESWVGRIAQATVCRLERYVNDSPDSLFIEK